LEDRETPSSSFSRSTPPSTPAPRPLMLFHFAYRCKTVGSDGKRHWNHSLCSCYETPGLTVGAAWCVFLSSPALSSLLTLLSMQLSLLRLLSEPLSTYSPHRVWPACVFSLSSFSFPFSLTLPPPQPFLRLSTSDSGAASTPSPLKLPASVRSRCSASPGCRRGSGTRSGGTSSRTC
jgi:hypothetical protein